MLTIDEYHGTVEYNFHIKNWSFAAFQVSPYTPPQLPHHRAPLQEGAGYLLHLSPTPLWSQPWVRWHSCLWSRPQDDGPTAARNHSHASWEWGKRSRYLSLSWGGEGVAVYSSYQIGRVLSAVYNWFLCSTWSTEEWWDKSKNMCALIQHVLATINPPSPHTHTSLPHPHTHTHTSPTPSPDPGDFHLHSLLAQLMACIDSRPAERVPGSYGECCTVQQCWVQCSEY